MRHKPPHLFTQDISNYLHRHYIQFAGKGYFLAWFDEKLERILDSLWMSSPSSAFTLHKNMNALIMKCLRTAVPEVASYGCAPLPEWTPELKPVLNAFGLEQFLSGQLNCAHSVLTFHPWRGGCLVCSLNQGHKNTSLKICSY